MNTTSFDRVCSDGHVRIAFDGKNCPVCLLLEVTGQVSASIYDVEEVVTEKTQEEKATKAIKRSPAKILSFPSRPVGGDAA